MTVRTAEILMACVMAFFSGYLMWKSAELPIGWVPGEGPGGGFWPFWLAAIMLASCIGIAVNWLRRSTAIAKSTEAFMPRAVAASVGVVVLALTVTVFLMGWAGVYIALFFFLLFYVGVLGRHGVVMTLLIAFISPIVTFMFFEVLLSITLPKGLSEPYFDPIYARVYRCPSREGLSAKISCYIDPTSK